MNLEAGRGVEPRYRGLQPRTLPLGQPVRVGTRGGNRTRFPTLRTSDPKPVDDTGEIWLERVELNHGSPLIGRESYR